MGTTMKRIIWAIVIIAFLGYCANDYYSDKAKEKAQREQEEELERTIIGAVDQLVSRTNAINNWAKTLQDNKKNGFEKILTIDLERLWLKGQPILFIGDIDDIATYNDQYYTLKIDADLLNNLNILGNALSLELKCDKAKVDTFIKKYPNSISHSFFFGSNNSVAVAAKVNEIKTSYYLGDEGEREEVKIGVGYCVDMIFVGDALL